MELIVTAVEIAGNAGAKRLQLSGKATVAGAVELKKCLLETLAAADEVIVEVSEVTDSDPTLFQLLCAAHRFAVLQDKRLTISPDGSGKLRQLAATSGFHPASGCCPEQSGCLLSKEEML